MTKLLGAMFLATLFFFAPTAVFAGGIDLNAIIPEDLDKASVWVGLAVLVFEYIVANTKLVTSNSTIDMVVSFIKKLFGLERYDQ